MDSVEVDIDVVNEEDDIKKRVGAEKAIRQTLKDEGGAAGLAPLVKAVKKFGYNKAELIKLLKKVVKVDKHKHGDYILTPINEKELSKKEIKGLKKVSKQLKGAVKAHDSQAKAIDKAIKEKLTKKSSLEKHIDDFSDSDAPQFKGKSQEKRRKMAVAAYLQKKNDK
tara:strand:- start:3495 stop:3995 length:501 start_codon:yes stop_codon:yes gene_type:complete